jgi:hypothetical protein
MRRLPRLFLACKPKAIGSCIASHKFAAIPISHKPHPHVVSSYRLYSVKSHYQGVLYSLYFVNEAFKKAIEEMQDTVKREDIAFEKHVQILNTQFKMFDLGMKVFSKLEREGYVVAVHEKINEVHKTRKEDLAILKNLDLEKFKKHHAIEMTQLHKCERALHELNKFVHTKDASKYLALFMVSHFIFTCNYC